MEALRTNKKLLASALAVLIAAPSFGGVIGSTDPKENNNELNYEELDPFFEQDNQYQDVTFKIYDFEDNLVLEQTLKKDEPKSMKLVKLLNKSDYLTENGVVSYYRLND